MRLQKKSVFEKLFFMLTFYAAVSHAQSYKFDFGSGAAASGYIQVTPQTRYSSTQGYGIDKGTVSSVTRDGTDAVLNDYLTTTDEFFFSVAVPQGNYDVTVIFGDATEPTSTTVKAENRRLLFDRISTNPGMFARKTITVNRREVKSIDGSVIMSIKDRELDYYTWDKVLTLQFSGKKPAVCGVEIVKNNNAITLFLCGNSTVVDQLTSPWCSWGQMIPCFFNSGVSIANYAESGLTSGGFLSMKRLDKIMADAGPGDYVFVEFGHNDQKSSSDVTNFPSNLKTYRDKIKAKGAIPVFVTPTARQNENDPLTSVGGLAQKMRETAVSLGVTFIDLNQMVIDLHKALGSNTKYLYMYTASDQTHFCEYGGYELARCVMKGLEEKFPSLKSFFIPEYTTFNPSQPDPLDYLTKDKVPVNVNTFTVNVTAEPGGTVYQNPQGKNLTRGTKVSFTAVPSGGWKFTGWSGVYNGNDSIYVIDSLDSDKSLTASFMPVDINNKVYEAEYGVMVNSVAESTNSGFSGTGYANFNNETGSYIEIPVYVTESGEKNVELTFANGSSSERFLSVSVNGGDLNSLSFSSTGSWTTWNTKEIRLNLNKGINTIILQSVASDGGPNIDKIVLGNAVSNLDIPYLGKPDIVFNLADFTIQTEHHTEAVRVRMYRMDGKIVLNRKMTGSNRYQLPINHLENGLYLLELVSRNGARVFNISLFK